MADRLAVLVDIEDVLLVTELCLELAERAPEELGLFGVERVLLDVLLGKIDGLDLLDFDLLGVAALVQVVDDQVVDGVLEILDEACVRDFPVVLGRLGGFLCRRSLVGGRALRGDPASLKGEGETEGESDELTLHWRSPHCPKALQASRFASGAWRR